MLYIIEGTGTSVQQGMNTFQPITDVMSCFHPNTDVKLKNGQIYHMKDVPLGSILAYSSPNKTINSF